MNPNVVNVATGLSLQRWSHLSIDVKLLISPQLAATFTNILSVQRQFSVLNIGCNLIINKNIFGNSHTLVAKLLSNFNHLVKLQKTFRELGRLYLTVTIKTQPDFVSFINDIFSTESFVDFICIQVSCYTRTAHLIFLFQNQHNKILTNICLLGFFSTSLSICDHFNNKSSNYFKRKPISIFHFMFSSVNHYK